MNTNTLSKSGIAIAACCVCACLNASDSIQPTPYRADGNAIVGHNLGHYHNRPLFINNTNAFLLAGDKPLVRFGQGQRVYGALMIALVRGAEGRWLHQCGDILAAYRAGRMTWTIRDSRLDGLRVTLDAVPMDGHVGFAVRLAAEGTRPGDRLVWAYGSTLQGEGPWNLDVHAQRQWYPDGFAPEECRGTVVGTGENGWFTLAIPPGKGPGSGPKLIAGRCSAASEIAVADAAVWKDPVVFSQSKAAGLPILRGSTALAANSEVIWVVEASDGDKPGDPARLLDPVKTFADGIRRTDAMAVRVTASTPEPRLDALLSCAAAELDGTWYPPCFVHGTMDWNAPYLGWYTIYGQTICGWHERVSAAAKFYLGSQVRESNKTRPKADPARRLCIEHPDSRFYGSGRILKHQYRYDMQSQFFDQLVTEWRWTGDPEFERLLRPALELHLQWARDCFDPDGDGLYESYINTMPTDSVWYNGGASAEETAFVYRGHQAALDMARRAGDTHAAEAHAATLAKIRDAFLAGLWIPRKGHPGKYREQGGHRRLHEDPWLYSICLPVEAGLLNPRQAAEALYYTEWGLENVRTAFGGRHVFASNWVPAVRSVRWRDSIFLPLSYFRTGLAEQGWECLKGQLLDSFAWWPANLAQGANTFYRQVAEGLFGCVADYPNGIVRVAPQFPADWDRASIRTPDLAVSFQRQGDDETLCVELTRPAAMELVIPVRARHVVAVKVNGQDVAWEVLPSFGKSEVRVRLPERASAVVTVTVRDRLPQFAPVQARGNAGEAVTLRAEGEGVCIAEHADPQGVLEGAAVEDNAVVGRLANNAGHHTVHVRVQCGELPQWRLFRVEIDDPAAAAGEAETLAQVPAGVEWTPVDLQSVLNADVRTIYRQEYLSPRPETVSARIGSDGYSPWTFPFWRIGPPEIGLDGVPKLLDEKGMLKTPQGVPFAWPGEAKNVAFTSLWDNWPKQVTVPVGRKADAAWFLICGSTNPMQCHIANAVIRLKYAGGQEDTLELVPPRNYWNLSPIGKGRSNEKLMDRTDYDYRADAFCLPKTPPTMVQLGENCRAMVLNRRLRPEAVLESITLEALSQEVVVGLMGLSLMKVTEKP